MDFKRFLDEGNSFVFGFEGVLFPEKDYLLQVYYLFSHFIEYAEQQPATEILDFMKSDYAQNGREGIFDRAIEKLGIPEKYRLNFELLLKGAKLPLKLELFPQMRTLLEEVAGSGNQIFLLVEGNPEQQLNKIRQTEWMGLAENLTVYFVEEAKDATILGGLQDIIGKHNLHLDAIVFIGKEEDNFDVLEKSGIKYFHAAELLTN